MSHRRISKAARQHLLAVVSQAHNRAARPLYFAKATVDTPDRTTSLWKYLSNQLRYLDRAIVLSVKATTVTVQPRGYVRVVGGKGGRKRGVRGLVEIGPHVPRFGTQRRAAAPGSGIVSAWKPSRSYEIGEIVKDAGVLRCVRAVGSA